MAIDDSRLGTVMAPRPDRTLQNLGTFRWPYPRSNQEAEGAGREILDIAMLNARTELAYRLVTLDGCTSFWCVAPIGALQGQNWDFFKASKTILIQSTIKHTRMPTVKMQSGLESSEKLESTVPGLPSTATPFTYRADDRPDLLPIYIIPQSTTKMPTPGSPEAW